MQITSTAAAAVKQKNPQRIPVWRVFMRNKLAVVGLVLIVFWVSMAIFAPLVVTHDPIVPDIKHKLLGPGQAGHLMGTDNFGRDIFSRIIYGARISIWSGLISVGIAFGIGLPLGGIAGYKGGWVSNVIMRLMDALSSFPSLVLAITIAASIGQGIASAMIAVGIVTIPNYARLTFAQTSSIKNMPYIEASRAVGKKTTATVVQHIFPNILPQLLVRATLGLGSAILIISSLSFLGLGISPPTAEWGNMISEGRLYIVSGQWWMTTFPGLAIMTTILGFNLVGDGIRDVMDPRVRTGM